MSVNLREAQVVFILGRTLPSDSSVITLQPAKADLLFMSVGGPCAGKGFLCSKTVEELNDIAHISMGDILRAERNKAGSPYAEEIERQMREGGLVSSELSLELLQTHIAMAMERGRRKFILDGFPRKLDQFTLFTKKVCLS